MSKSARRHSRSGERGVLANTSADCAPAKLAQPRRRATSPSSTNRPRLAGAARTTLARDAALELVTVRPSRPSAPAGRHWHDVSCRSASNRDDHERQARARPRMPARGGCRPVGRHDPQRLDAAVMHGIEQLDRLRPAASRGSARARSGVRSRSSGRSKRIWAAAGSRGRDLAPPSRSWPVTEKARRACRCGRGKMQLMMR